MLNNLYNNEVLTLFIFENVFKRVESLPISKALLILPLFLDTKVMKKFKQFRTEKNMIDYTLNNTNIFSNQKKLYYEYMFLSINTIQLCIESGVLELKNNELSLEISKLLFEDFDYEGNKLIENMMVNMEKISNLLKKEEAYELYYALRIEV